MNHAQEIKQLRANLTRWSNEYYNGVSTVLDAEYDQAFRRLQQLEAAYPELAEANSPTARVGSPVPQGRFTKVRHSAPMLSLDNTFAPQEVLNYFRSVGHTPTLIVEPKIDGLALEIQYVNGELTRALTRGDGVEGEDVTANVRTIATVPLVVASNFTGNVRGEVYLSRSRFNELNAQLAAEGEDTFSNPRNAASGTLKQRDSRVVAQRRLSFLAYQLEGAGFSNLDSNRLRFIRDLGFTSPHYRLVTIDLGSIAEAIQEFADTRHTFDYETDGVVFKIDDYRTRDELGLGTRSPKWAVAFKFPPEEGITRLNSITLQVGRTGIVTPVAELEPLQLSGSVVSRASLCNADEIARLGIAVGDKVVIIKAAEIIPHVVRAYEKVYIDKDGNKTTVNEELQKRNRSR